MKTLAITIPTIVAALMFGSAVNPAQAVAAEQCGGEKDARAFTMGVHQGETLINASFDAMKRDCKRLAEIRILVESLKEKAPDSGNSELVCRSLGMNQGFDDALATLTKGCAS